MGINTGIEAADTGCWDHIINEADAVCHKSLSQKKDNLSFVLAKVVKIFLSLPHASEFVVILNWRFLTW